MFLGFLFYFICVCVCVFPHSTVVFLTNFLCAFLCNSPNDIAYVFSGYAPLSICLVQHAVQSGWSD